jgi:hypothetical protein
MLHLESKHVSTDDDTSLDSFAHEEDEMEAQILSPGRFTASREIRLMRKLRVWRQEQEVQVRYLFAGVVFNIGLVVFTLLLISMISKNKGLCFVDMTAPAIFASGQLEKCSTVQESTGHAKFAERTTRRTATIPTTNELINDWHRNIRNFSATVSLSPPNVDTCGYV